MVHVQFGRSSNHVLATGEHMTRNFKAAIDANKVHVVSLPPVFITVPRDWL